MIVSGSVTEKGMSPFEVSRHRTYAQPGTYARIQLRTERKPSARFFFVFDFFPTLL